MAKRKNPVMIEAGRKAAETRKKNKQERELKLKLRAKLAWETRRENEKNGVGFKFSNVDGESKIATRNSKVDLYIKSGVTSGNFLLLPSQTCADIFLINERMPKNNFSFKGCEIDKKSFKVANKKAKDNGLNLMLFESGIETYIDRVIGLGETDYFAHADIDLCQTFSMYKQVVEKTMNNNLVKKGGIISFTFCARDVNIKKTALEILKKTRFNELDKKVAKDKQSNNFSLPTINKWLDKLCKDNYKIVVEPYTYSDSKKGNHMIHGSIQRIK
jgi:hypothetical protein